MRKYEDKTKDQPIDELVELRQRIAELEKLENQLKLAEEALRESEKRFRELAELLPEMVFEIATREYYIRQMVFEIATEGNLTFANQIALDTFGYTQEDFDKGLNALQMTAPEDRDRARDNFRRKLRGEDLGITEYMAQRKDGSRFPIIVHTSVITDEEGKLAGLRGIAVNITERKLMEVALRESEKRFRDVAELLPQTVFETDEKGNLTFVSTYGFTSYGYTQEDFDKGLNVLQMLVPKDHDRAKENIRRILSGEKSGGNEYTALRKDGSTFPVLVYSCPIIHENKSVGLKGIVIDITDRKRAEEALRKSEERFQQVVENAQEVIWEVDADGLFTYISPMMEKIRGYKPEEIIGKKHFYDTFHPEDREELKKMAFKILAEKQPFRELIVQAVHKNGKKVWLSVSGVPILDEKGNLLGYRGASIDITEQKKAEDALKKSEKKFRELTELLPEIVFEIDTEGNFTFLNQIGFDVVGYTQEDLDKGLNAFQLIVPEDRDKAKENLQRRQRGEDRGIVEYTMQRKDGSRFPIIVHASIIIDEEGKPAGLRGIAVDITERKRAEEALKQHAEELERSKAELEQSLEELLERVEREHEGLVTIPSPVIDIEERGAIFFYPLDREEEAYALFRSRKDANRLALAITRTFPPRFHRKIGREVETVWLTSNRVPEMVCVDPSNTMDLLLVLTEFFKRAPEGMVLFEGVEYVISMAGFERFLHIVQLLNDKITMTNGTIYMILELGVLEEKEAKHILRECLPPSTSGGGEEEVKYLGNEDL